jgi:hypothetical protein
MRGLLGVSRLDDRSRVHCVVGSGTNAEAEAEFCVGKIITIVMCAKNIKSGREVGIVVVGVNVGSNHRQAGVYIDTDVSCAEFMAWLG